MKICTWNLNSLNVRLDQLCSWISAKKPDVVCIQETRMVDEKFPVDRISELGYFSTFAGQKSNNGVAVISRSKMTNLVTDFPNFEDPQRRLLATTIDNIRIVNVYIPFGGEVASDKYKYKLKWLGHLLVFIKVEMQRHENVILIGDYNIAPTDDDVYDPERWEGKVLCSEPERNMYRNLIDTGLTDLYRKFKQPPKSYSSWSYSHDAFQLNNGFRIDHILASVSMANKCIACEIDKEPRSWERPSDHAPVLATFDL